MTAMRNRLIHAYFDIDHDIVWITTKDHLPPLIQKLEQLLEINLKSKGRDSSA